MAEESEAVDIYYVEKNQIETLAIAAKRVKKNVRDVFDKIKEKEECDMQLISDARCWRELKTELDSGRCNVVYKADIERLITEAMQIKECLPKVLKKEYYNAYTKLETAENEIIKLKAERKKLTAELERTRKKQQAALSELEAERQEMFTLKKDLHELTEVNSQQSDYCSRMGAASCTLLWRISQRDECIETLVAGTQTEDFLQLVCHTLESYALAIQNGGEKGHDSNSDELQFVLALCGVGTNIAASSYGREFLMTNSNGNMLVDSLLSTLCRLPPACKEPMKIRNLCLKFLYNISINQKGVKHLAKNMNLVNTLAAITEGDINIENRLLAVRLIQSLMLEAENINLVHKVVELLPIEKMRNIAVNMHGELQEAFLELIKDIKFFQREP